MASFYLIGGHDFDLKSNLIAKNLLNLAKTCPKILYIPICATNKEKALNNLKKEFYGLDYQLQVIHLEEYPSFENVLNLATNADIIYFPGGNTSKALNFLKTTGYDKLIFNLSKLDVIIAGVSAGAMIFCEYGLADANSYKDHDEYYNYKLINGLGILAITFCPHFDEGNRILYFKDELTTNHAFALENNTAIYLENEKLVNFYNVKKYHVYYFSKANNYIMNVLKKEKLITLGPEGTFSHQAALKYEKENSLLFELCLKNSLQQIESSFSNAKYALLPLENSIDGFVTETIDILARNNFYFIDEIEIPVNFNFISKTRNLKDVKKVFVSFKAKGQCIRFIHDNNLEVVETDSNMMSYERIKNSDETYGAIVPSHLDIKNFHTNAKNIQDIDHNFTRFILLSKEKEKNKQENLKYSLIIEPILDEPGILMNVLLQFKEENINIEAIMSRPMKKVIGTYYFYIEFKTNEYSYHRLLNNLSLNKKIKVHPLFFKS